ncbi:MAG: hypothetical protein ABTQ31_09055 [Rhizobiaceae bacterium]
MPQLTVKPFGAPAGIGPHSLAALTCSTDIGENIPAATKAVSAVPERSALFLRAILATIPAAPALPEILSIYAHPFL